MCGIVGTLFDRVTEQQLTTMMDAMTPRGPDSFGHWQDSTAGLTLGHRRLKIIDLSGHGHQPMHSSDERYCLTYNGEIFNHLEVRDRIERDYAYPFRGHSDTESLVAAIQVFGLNKALNLIDGQFAFGLWDRQLKRLSLGRDRFGEKPLYYGWIDESFVFASTLKPLMAHPRFQSNVDHLAVQDFLAHGYIGAPRSIFTNIRKLEPGHLVYVDQDKTVSKSCYWDMDRAIAKSRANPLACDSSEATELLRAELSQAVRSRSIADVPLGCFLSGGIDSSLVTALLQSESTRPVQTFTVGFSDPDMNEAPYAQRIAQHLGTDHTELYVEPEQLWDLIPKLPQIYDEPFADSSQLPTYLISEVARRKVTVALSGDGGDELFGGYNRHIAARGFLNRVTRLPQGLNLASAKLLESLSRVDLRRFQSTIPQLNLKLAKAARSLANGQNQASIYRSLTCSDGKSLLVEPAGLLPELPGELDGFEMAEQFMRWDTHRYLPGDILTKVDRASMANSLEARIPYLARSVFELAWRLPLSVKIEQGTGKVILRQILSDLVPTTLFERPKAGFAIPIGAWLKGPLRAWTEDLIAPSMLKKQGLLDAAAVEGVWQEHLTGKRDNTATMWNVLMLQTWAATHTGGTF